MSESRSRTDTSSSQAPIVSLSDVSVRFEQSSGGIAGVFDDPDTVHAVDHVDLDIYENDVVALVGESGCGKTTLGKTMIGVQRPTDGHVEYRGQDVWETKDRRIWERRERAEDDFSKADIRQALQMIHQDPGSSLNPARKLRASLAAPLNRWRPDLSAEERDERIHTLLEYVGMSPAEDFANRYPHQLSGGEQQRTALVRALLMNPDLILADEAVSALDVSLRVETMDLMLSLQSVFNTSFVFISHNLSNARYIAGNAGGRIGVMYLGEIVEIGPAEEIISNPQHPYTKVLMWATARLNEDQEVDDPPLRHIDVPNPVNPPSGCRFHTRCPEAREACKRTTPTLQITDDESHKTACFREYDDHPYWDSTPLTEVESPSNTDSVTSDIFDD